MVEGAPKITELAVDLHKDLIQMPAPLRIPASFEPRSRRFPLGASGSALIKTLDRRPNRLWNRLVELRGFEPLTFGVGAPAVTAPSLQGLILREGAPPHAALDPCCFACPTRGYRLERLAGLGENRCVARCGRVTAHDHIDVERIQLYAPAERPVLSAAMRVEPEPRNGSITMSPRLLRSRSASSSMAIGLTVG